MTTDCTNTPRLDTNNGSTNHDDPHAPVGTLKNQELFRITRYRYENISRAGLLMGYIHLHQISTKLLIIFENC